MAARTLIARGYRRIAFLGGPQQATSTIDRRAGFLELARTHEGISVTESFARAYSFEAGRAEMLGLLRADPAEAYFCGDDVIAIGAMSALRESGRAVPGDVGILGLNDMEMARWQNIDLTTIRQPIREIIDASIDLVTAMFQDPDRQPEARLFGCQIVERGTLRPLPRPPGGA
jgi:DNA-binding LacI/PurR family transcriptional regulator